MAKKRKRKRKAATVPRLGPPLNLRPAGAHKERRRKTRAQARREALLEASEAVEGT